ncbi:M28 family peptidase [Sphingomonas sp.]|uniref:M28 family metallopeptidase n=1 Tax=Sphingomonas sp. TaxID=28214 RepID=UPI001EBA25F6|nr:M28 family peptidase [Sphingomonas sp.]MBX3595304.1 M28 family peptidase [Sphingomonas sp.]
MKTPLALALLLAALAPVALAQSATVPATAAAPAREWTVKPEWIAAHVNFLAGPELRGRGSMTRDEAIAAAYVAARFQGFGLRPAPGAAGFLQKVKVIRPRLDGAPELTLGGKALAGATLLLGGAARVEGRAIFYAGDDAAAMPAGEVVFAGGGKLSAMTALRAAHTKGIRLLVLRESDETKALWDRLGRRPRIESYLAGEAAPEGVSVVVLPAAAFDRARRAAAGTPVVLTLAGLVPEEVETTNAIGYLPGTDPRAGVILLSAHLDHLGVRPDGTVMPGANDDASGTAAVLELAHALATGGPHRRGILFAAFGSEEAGGFGSRAFTASPPVPLADIVANISIEMIGAQDPKLPAGTMMMTGFERSTLGPALVARGALIAKDPYPDQNFFERSDNYSLALRGVVAHTISGWAVTPTYHSPRDTIANLDIPFMTRAIQSLIGPARWLADGDFRPEWTPGGRPGK